MVLSSFFWNENDMNVKFNFVVTGDGYPSP